MSIRRAIPVIVTNHPEASRRFYEEVLGFNVVIDEPGFLLLASPSVPTSQVILAWVAAGASDPTVRDAVVSIEVADVDRVHAEAVARGLDIVRPLQDESWGVRRFFVREASGAVINIAGRPSPGTGVAPATT